jgi:hypothetical protein
LRSASSAMLSRSSLGSSRIKTIFLVYPCQGVGDVGDSDNVSEKQRESDCWRSQTNNIHWPQITGNSWVIIITLWSLNLVICNVEGEKQRITELSRRAWADAVAFVVR